MSSKSDKGVLFSSMDVLARRWNSGVILFYLVLLIFYGWAFAVGPVSQVQSMVMKKFHPGSMPFSRWALCQFLPSMYSFKNELILSPRLLPGDFHQPLPGDALKFSVNHYPFRILYFSNVREVVYANLTVYVYVRNFYRGREIVSSYMVEKIRQGAHPVLLNMYERIHR